MYFTLSLYYLHYLGELHYHGTLLWKDFPICAASWLKLGLSLPPQNPLSHVRNHPFRQPVHWRCYHSSESRIHLLRELPGMNSADCPPLLPSRKAVKASEGHGDQDSPSRCRKRLESRERCLPWALLPMVWPQQREGLEWSLFCLRGCQGRGKACLHKIETKASFIITLMHTLAHWPSLWLIIRRIYIFCKILRIILSLRKRTSGRKPPELLPSAVGADWPLIGIGAGIGTKFIAYWEHFIREQGGRELVFFTNSEKNIAFYKKLGYDLEGRPAKALKYNSKNS